MQSLSRIFVVICLAASVSAHVSCAEEKRILKVVETATVFDVKTMKSIDKLAVGDEVEVVKSFLDEDKERWLEVISTKNKSVRGFLRANKCAPLWEEEMLTKDERYYRWANAAGPYGPEMAIGASCMAFAPNGTLYLACEKFPELLIIPPTGSPQHRTLKGVVTGPDKQANVDLEAMSIHDGSIFLMDEDNLEDNLVIYQTSLENPGAVRTLPVIHNGRITTKNVDGNRSNLASVEGLVVSTYLGPESYRASLQGKDAYFYLLDERDYDKDDGRMKAKLYIGTLVGDSIEIKHDPVVFELDDPSTAGADPKYRFRLCELFEIRGHLYALKTLKGRYYVVHCDLETGILTEICNFTDASNKLRAEGFDNNFEGAAVHQDGHLFLTADNEEFEHGGDGSPPAKGDGRGVTPLVSLRIRQ